VDAGLEPESLLAGIRRRDFLAQGFMRAPLPAWVDQHLDGIWEQCNIAKTNHPKAPVDK